MAPDKVLKCSNHGGFQLMRVTIWRRTERLQTDRGGAVARN